MVVDYSQSVNCFTLLNSYFQSRINELTNTVEEYVYFSTWNLPSIKYEDLMKHCIACRQPYQFCQITFGITNCVVCFHHINKVIIGNSLMFGFPGNMFVCRESKGEHDINLKRFTETVKRFNLIYDQDKCTFS